MVGKLPQKLRDKLMVILRNQIAMEPNVGKALVGELQGLYSYRLSYKDRIVYSIDEEKKLIIIHRARTHYGD